MDFSVLYVLNYKAVLAATAAMYVLGWLWYSPVLFGKTWMKLAGAAPGDMKKGVPLCFVYGLLNTLLSVLGLAVAISLILPIPSAKEGVLTACVLWLGFAVPMNLSDVIWGKMPMKLFWIHAGHYLVSFAAVGAIVGGWW